MPNKKIGFLQLVWDSVSGHSSKRKEQTIQMDLFSQRNEHSVLVIYFYDIDGELFSETLKNAHPKYIIDMRPNPKFDISGYSRKVAFADFESIGAKYFDYLELLGADKKDNEFLISAVENKIFNKSKKGPFAFIFGKKEQYEKYEEKLLHILPKDNHKWSFSILPNKMKLLD